MGYIVQPKAVAEQLLKQIAALEKRHKDLDEQMALVLQELENARKEAESTRLQLDERLAHQLCAEENQLQRARRSSLVQQERLDREQADQLHELEKARAEVSEMKAKLAAIESNGSGYGQAMPVL